MEIDYKAPDYTLVYRKRLARLAEFEADPKLLAAVKIHYRHNPWDFVSDWGMTADPRNLDRGLPVQVPFVLWPKQVEYLQWVHQRWLTRQRGLAEKSRDCGVTWLSVGYAIAMWTFHQGFTARFASRKEELVDKLGDIDSIFEKISFFIDNLPAIFRPVGFSPKCRNFMRVLNPENSSALTGEAGENIGRGGRSSIVFVDEAAFIERQEAIDAALSQTTNCQIDISTFNGNGNLFYAKKMKFEGTDAHFIFDWRDDPRKDDAWYQKQKREQSEQTVAQEIDRDPNASNVDSFVPAKWVVAAIDAHKLLNFRPTGLRVTGFDPADTGDSKAVVHRYGSVVMQARQLTRGNINDAIFWAFEEAFDFRAEILKFDAEGMGGPSMRTALTNISKTKVPIQEYHGAGAVTDPGKRIRRHSVDQKAPVDMFKNYRAQTWNDVRGRFERTYEAVERVRAGQLVNLDPDTLISLSSTCDCIRLLQAELSRPMRIYTANGKIQCEAKASMRDRGVQSPNLADALVIAFSARLAPVVKARPVATSFTPYDAAMGY